ncbi:hypothetical protein ACLB2K_059935 [Fragaria x ananassa]
MWRCGRCVASQSALGWGDSLLSVAGRCLGESVRAWLGTVAMWRVNARLIGDCRFVALRPLRGQSVRAWLGRLAIERCGPLPWRVSLRLIGDYRYVALRPLRGESVRAWLGRLAIERCEPLPWRVSPRLIGDCRYVASQSALGWGLSLCGESGLGVQRISPRLVGDCHYVASQSALGWGLSLCGESVRAWLGTVAMWRCGRYVASQSALGWGDSLLSVAGRCLGESVRAWLGTVAMCPRLIGDSRYVALRPLLGELVRAWLGRLAIERCGPLPWRVSPRLIGDCRYVALQPLRGEFSAILKVSDWETSNFILNRLGASAQPFVISFTATTQTRCFQEFYGERFVVGLVRVKVAEYGRSGLGVQRISPRLVGDCHYVASQSALGWGLSLCGESVRAWLGTVAMWRCGRYVASQSALGWGDSLLSVAGRCLGESVRAWLGTVAMCPRLIGDCRYVALRPLLGELVRAWLGRLAIERCGPLPWRVSPRLIGDCRYVALQPLRGEFSAILKVSDWETSNFILNRLGASAQPFVISFTATTQTRCFQEFYGERFVVGLVRVKVAEYGRSGLGVQRISPRLVGDCHYVASQSALGWGLSLCGESVRAWLGTVAMWRCGRYVASQSALGWGDSLLSVAGRCLGESVRAWLGTVAMW